MRESFGQLFLGTIGLANKFFFLFGLIYFRYNFVQCGFDPSCEAFKWSWCRWRHYQQSPPCSLSFCASNLLSLPCSASGSSLTVVFSTKLDWRRMICWSHGGAKCWAMFTAPCYILRKQFLFCFVFSQVKYFIFLVKNTVTLFGDIFFSLICNKKKVCWF